MSEINNSIKSASQQLQGIYVCVYTYTHTHTHVSIEQRTQPEAWGGGGVPQNWPKKPVLQKTNGNKGNTGHYRKDLLEGNPHS